MNIYIIGSGTFGTALANELSFNINNQVLLFARSVDKVNEINNLHTNKKYFPNIKLNQSLKATNDYLAIKEADVVFIALPSSVLEDVLNKFNNKISNTQLVVNLSKGIFNNGGTIVDYLKSYFNSENILSLKGPSFASEIVVKSNTLLTLGYSNHNQLSIINKIFNGTNIYIDSTNDVRGVELLSVVKNIYALFIGIVDAKYDSPNTRFMFMTKVFSEIRMISEELKISPDTLFLSCGLGDVCLTSLNDLSRNRTLGLLIGKGFYNPISQENTVVFEGLNSINIIFNLIDSSLILKLPILRNLHNFFAAKKKNFIIDFNEFLIMN
jgi:glycerol-3-phosphate dehydrogenase